MGARETNRHLAVHTREKVNYCFANVVGVGSAYTPKPDNQ